MRMGVCWGWGWGCAVIVTVVSPGARLELTVGWRREQREGKRCEGSLFPYLLPAPSPHSDCSATASRGHALPLLSVPFGRSLPIS